MAINGNDGAKIDVSTRETLLDKEVDRRILGNGHDYFGGGMMGPGNYGYGVTKAGITENFVTEFTTAIENYKDNIEKTIDAIDSGVASNAAFQGAKVTASLQKFIDAIKSVSKEYLASLTKAETTIIKEVEKSYQNQDTAIQSDFNSDISKLES